jgi:hypothetical protein
MKGNAEVDDLGMGGNGELFTWRVGSLQGKCRIVRRSLKPDEEIAHLHVESR